MFSIPGYKTTELIYEGFLTRVYRAANLKSGKSVILKVVKQGFQLLPSADYFKRDFEIGRSLDTGSVVKAFERIKLQGRTVTIMEDFGGESMNRIIKDGSLSLEETVAIAVKAASALSDVHDRHVIHKDVKSANIIYNSETGQLKLTDFGIAVRLRQGTPSTTNPDVMEGTLTHISPEQTGRLDRRLDYRTDLYSLGVTFYKWFTGGLPFEGNDTLELVHCHIARQPTPPNDISPEIPRSISDIVMKLLAKSPEERYQSAWGLRVDLEECRRQLVETGRVDEFPLGKRDWFVQFNISEKIYGRNREIDSLKKVLDGVGGDRVEMVLISGRTGTGKSTLVNELLKPLALKTGYFAAGSFDNRHRGSAYSAISEAFGELVERIMSEDEQQIQAVKDELKTAVGINGRFLSGVIPDINLLIDEQPSMPVVLPDEIKSRFNYAFKNLLRVVTQTSHPLVLFFDDLQRADQPSLNLIKYLATEDIGNRLLLVFAYRDDEVSRDHPSMKTIAAIEKAGIGIRSIHLSALDGNSINQMLTDTFRCQNEESWALSRLIHRKTAGNPFFVKSLLQSLYNEQLIVYSPDSGWSWNLDGIEAVGATDNTVESMLERIKQLSASTQNALKTAACLGDTFSVDILASVGDRSEELLLQDLSTAFQTGIVCRSGARIRFAHDRLWEAAYSLNTDQQRKNLHLKTGQILLQRIHGDGIEDRLFDIVHQFNSAGDSVGTESERIETVELNRRACLKAISSAAFEQAADYAGQGIRRLPETCWESHYDLAFDLYTDGARVEHFIGNVEAAERLLAVVMSKAKSPADKIQVLLTRSGLIAPRYKAIFDMIVEGIGLLGLTIPESEDDLERLLQREMRKLETRLSKIRPEQLMNAGEIEDSEVKTLIGFLARLGTPTSAALGKTNLADFFTSRSMNLILKHGNFEYSAQVFCYYASYLAGHGEYQRASEFSGLAIRLSERYHHPGIRGYTHFIHATRVQHWIDHLPNLENHYRFAISSAQESGLVDQLAHILSNYIRNKIIGGQSLTETHRELERCMGDLGSAQRARLQEHPLHRICLQLLRNLSGLTTDKHTFGDDAFDDKAFRSDMQAIPLVRSSYFHAKLVIAWMFDDRTEGLSMADKVYREIWNSMGEAIIPDGLFYAALVYLSLCSTTDREENAVYLERVEAILGRLKTWATYCRKNILHKRLIVEAERARVLGNDTDAMGLYDQAIEAACEAEFVGTQAVAEELAAKYHLSQGRDRIAAMYLQEAFSLYQRWGALAKTKDLERRYPQLLATVVVENRDLESSSSTKTKHLDLDTVMKASRAISGEIVLDRLLSKLLKLIIENAGAERGFLIRTSDQKSYIEVKAGIESDEVGTLEAVPIDQSKDLCRSIVQYVVRTGDNVILHDAVGQGKYTENPYIQKNGIRSVLCMPFHYRDEIYGVLYLENNLVPNIFTKNRLEFLQALLAQAATSMVNVELFEERAKTEQELRRSEEKYRSIIESIKDEYFEVDLNGKFTFFNKALQENTGLSKGQLLGMSFRKYTDTEVVDSVRRTYSKVLTTGQPEIVEFEIKKWRADTLGFEKRTIENSVSLIRDKNDNPIGFRGLSRDLTERIKAEEEIRRLRNQLDNIFNSMPSVLISVDADGRVTNWNNQAVKMTGIAFDQAKDKIFTEIYPQLANEMDRVHVAIKEKTIQENPKVAFTMDGHTRYSDITIYPLVADGIDGAVIRMDDVTRRIRMEELMIQTEKLMSVGGLAAGMAHEINNPLGGILQGSQIILNRFSPELKNNIKAAEECGIDLDRMSRYMEKRNILNTIQGIRESGERAAGIIKNMLQFSRKSDSNIAPTNMADLLERTVELANNDYDLKKQYDFRQIKIMKEFETSMNPVSCIETEIEQVVLNLLRNSAQAMAGEERPDNPRIVLRTRSDDDMAAIEIEDNGPGMDTETRKRIFEPFFTTKPVGTGTGLGLWVSYMIVANNHQGTIEVESKTDKGSKFVIRLPWAKSV
ncbi:MAG: AAA family ATPase [Proteobacteria bacterium]|nr:AAA family ATPase [Pseudomonadota bacterium]